VNYFELHIGDYDKATSHLTACEDGIYGRLMRRYYNTESPLPVELKAIQRFARARSREEKEAVETVLEEFFVLESDGWHHKRCDEEISKYQETQGDAEDRKRHETERKRRYRARRAELFEALREHGHVPPFDTAIEELELMLSRVSSQGTNTGTSTGTHEGTGRGRDASGTATHLPIPINPSRAEEREKPTAPAELPLGEPPAPTPKPAKRTAVKLDTWLATLGDADAIPADDPIFDYARQTGIPVDFLELSWLRFCEDMRQRAKLQRDWRAHYRNAVRGNWFKLWWFAPDGSCQLTTTGEQARRAAA